MILKKSFGQHFLNKPEIAKAIVDSLEPDAGEIIVEVGPGGGALTEHLGGPLVLVEADRDLIEELKTAYPDAEVIRADAAKVSFDDLVGNKPWRFIGNLPYNAGTAIIMNALESKNPPRRIVAMLQKEVAERMLAKPGKMSMLSVATQLMAKPHRLMDVKPGSFTPPPKVDSSVIILEVIPPSERSEHLDAAIKLAKKAFAHPRKQLHTTIGIDSKARPQELSTEQWLDLV